MTRCAYIRKRIAAQGLSVLFVASFAAGVSGGEQVSTDGPAQKPTPTNPGARPPNFIFILADDLGYMDVSPNNPKCFYDTPSLERLARSGMRFTNAYAACPVCSPTRYSILTGKYPTRAGLTNWLPGNPTKRFQGAPLATEMALAEVTIVEALRERGYHTAAVGKWHLGKSEEYWPEHQGFEINIGGWSAGSPRSYFSPYHNPRLPDGPPGEHLPKRLVDESIRIVERWKDEPFFLYLAFHSVHIPLQGRKDLVDKYTAKAGSTSKPAGPEFAEEEQVWPNAGKRQVRLVQGHAVYAAMVEAMDEQIGRLLDRLELLGIADRTVVVFTSDNGGVSTSEGLPTSNLPLRGGKGWLYEGGIREPLLVRWPGLTKPGSTCDVPVTSVDYYPTFLKIAGAGGAPRVDGVSIVPLLKGGTDRVHDAIYWHYPHYSNQGGFPGGAVRMGDWKLIERYEDGRVHLYNLADDIGERDDLAQEQPDRVKAMRDRLHAWYREVHAQFLRPIEGGPEPWRP